ncbi:MAG: hypothetical protein ACREQY_19260, partial [Candidatus Binatia bacterium]
MQADPRKLLRRTMLVLVAAAGISCGGLAWILSRGPIPLPFLDSRIEAALSGIAPDLIAAVGGTELAWSNRRPEIRVLDVTLTRRDGTPAAALPEL